MTTEGDIRHAMVKLDQLCRERGLIPQVGKLGIIKLSSLKDIDALISPFDNYFQGTRRIPISEPRSFKMLTSAIDLRGKKIIDKTSLRFALFRSPNSDRILRLVLRLWLRFPEHTDAYSVFTESYTKSKVLERFAKKVVRLSYPYDAVEGEMWKILARMASPLEIKIFCQDAIDTVKDPEPRMAAKIGALIFLCAAEKAGLGRYSSFLCWIHSPIVQAFVAPFLPLPSKASLNVVGHFLRRSTPDPALALTRTLQISGINPQHALPKNQTLNPVVQVVYEKAGVVSPSQPTRHDPIGALLSRRYGVPNWPNWKLLLEAEYTHAHQILSLANIYFDSYYTPWLAHQDAFNDVIFRALQRVLAAKGAPGAIPTQKSTGELIDFGALLADHTFGLAYPNLARDLQDVHRRRSRLPSSHPYEKRTGKRTVPLSRRERVPYLRKLTRVYNEIIKICKSIGV